MNIEVLMRAVHGSMVGFDGIKYYSLMGYTSIYMGILSGILSLIIAYLLDNDKYFELKVWQKLLIGGSIITFAELCFGLIFNVYLFQMNIWHYTGINFMHQISLETSLEWPFIITPMIISLDSYLTYWIYGEDKPVSFIKIYIDLILGR
ncbi:MULTISPECIES: hypothetical protein [unclassified Clostridium]|uniref:hypothetical protein n=1 Tax=unclassified Clostridium TaxID=2614128 RepID=UPI000297BF78|nr:MULTISPECIES: hypothetical protein [unclassified Clostridium]EKQ53160.1 MAG: hypothetical protein A370_03847 [Clostridium sp. Maddingley MBC34-26]